MGSRREEERNEKIIRGLMKLPPNRKCINCNSLGPQYVCTNFWTFVCMTCSGIHREFTHRVKSVSMAKFTSQEVEALQNGGNQRAREAYLNDWDTQRQRLPDSSNADKVRQFIKQVYVEKKYAGGKNSDKPPKDVQGIRNQEDGTRRASSYHSYSQSPPYDSQYEERRYGKQNAGLTRKPGSDRGPYEGKMSSIIYSPGRLSENACEDTFANEGSGARFSDYSASSGGDPFRSDVVSPNFQKDVGFSSLKPSVSSGSLDRQISNRSLEANFRRDTEGIPRPQRTASSGSFGSSGSTSVSLTSFNSRSFASPVSEPEQVSATRQDKTSTIAQSTLSGNTGIELFQAPFRSKSASSSSVDLFQAPQTFFTGSNDLIHPFSSHPSSLPIQHQTPQATTSLVDFFADFPQQPTDATLEKRSSEPSSSSKNEGWATFDSPQLAASVPASENQSLVNASYGGAGSVEKLDLFSSFDSSIKWPLPQNSDWQEHSPSVSDPWLGNTNNLEAPPVTSNTQTWNAFGEATNVAPPEGTKHNVEPLAKLSQPENPAQHLGFAAAQDLNIYGYPRPNSGPPSYKMPSNDNSAAPHASAVPPLGDASVQMSGIGYKSSNPFDISYDNDVEYNNMFLDMSSLQSTLPADAQMPLTFTGGPTHSWFPHNPVGVYAPVASQGGLAYMGGQTATTIPNVSAQGPVASVGGNPFA